MQYKLHYILVWNILIVIFMYLELNWNMNALSIFSIIDTVCFMSNINKRQIITTTSLLQWTTNVSSHSVVCFDVSIYWFTWYSSVCCENEKQQNNQVRHSRKTFCELEGFSINPWIFKIFTQWILLLLFNWTCKISWQPY